MRSVMIAVKRAASSSFLRSRTCLLLATAAAGPLAPAPYERLNGAPGGVVHGVVAAVPTCLARRSRSTANALARLVDSVGPWDSVGVLGSHHRLLARASLALFLLVSKQETG